LHARFAQHAWPISPHGAHIVPLQPTFGAVHRMPQHIWPFAPQPPQLPLLQIPNPGHIALGATQRPVRQHPPLAQPVDAQQG
jgi:hypothetical protein